MGLIKLVEDESFRDLDMGPRMAEKGTYERCTFFRCSLASFDIAHVKFYDCKFEECDLSMARTADSVFQDVQFIRCKLLGLRFDECSKTLLSFSFRDCQLDFSVFSRLKIKKTLFENCQLREVDFSGSDVSGAVFKGSDLARAVFDDTILENADLRNASNYSINLENNHARKAKFSIDGLPGLLQQYNLVIE
jgi:fluoroquinolone resistance protein